MDDAAVPGNDVYTVVYSLLQLRIVFKETEGYVKSEVLKLE